MKTHLNSGRAALQLLYFFLIALAIGQSLNMLFLKDESFIIPKGEIFILFFVFLSFIIRFFLGAYRVMSKNIMIEVRRAKIAIDSIGFFLQAILFFIFSLNFNDLLYAQIMVVAICVFDLLWLVLLVSIFRIVDKTSREWMLHNVAVAVIIIFNIFTFKNIYILLIVSLFAALFDFWYNRNFYFPSKGIQLKIFVAGPYGDNNPPEIIKENVEKAKNIGKEIALKGHIPFIPHTMLHGWERDNRFSVEKFKEIDFSWLDHCDALFFIAESKGADAELLLAEQKGLRIFKNLEEIPET